MKIKRLDCDWYKRIRLLFFSPIDTLSTVLFNHAPNRPTSSLLSDLMNPLINQESQLKPNSLSKVNGLL